MIEIYRQNGLLEARISDRTELIEVSIMLVCLYHKPLRNLLPQYSIERNCEHHCIRILREMGYTIITL